MYGIGVNRLGVTNSTGFNPSTLFAGGIKGAWYDMSDISTMFKVDGTTPAVVGEEVGKITDKSGNGHDLIQTNSDKCPILRVDTDGKLCLDFTTDDGMRTTSNLLFDTAGVNTMSVFAAAKKESDDLNQTVAELSNSVGTNNGAFRLFYASANQWRAIQKGTVANTIVSASIGNPDKSILTTVASIAAPSHDFRRNGSSIASNTSTLGTGNYGDYPLNIGGRASGGSANLDGKIYGLIVLGKVADTNEISNVESYLSDKSGVTI